MTYVRTHTGEKIICVWDDCRKPGHDEIKVKERHDDGQWWDYIFCTEFHKQLHINSPKSYGNVTVGAGHGRKN